MNTIMRYHYTLTRTAKIKKVKISNACEDAEKVDVSHIAGVM